MRCKYTLSALAIATLCWGYSLPSFAADPVPAAEPAPAVSSASTAESAPAANPAPTVEEAPAPQPAPNTEQAPATDSAPATESGAIEGTTDASETNADALAPVKEKLVSPEQEKMSTELKPKYERFTLLKSDDPEDYKRTNGIWVSDAGNGRVIYMRDFDGNDFYSLGNAGHDMGQFLNPEQVWVDVEGKLYIADCDNNRIVRTDDVRGYNWTNKTGFNHPRGVAQHGRRFIVSDTGNNRILIYNNFDDEVPMVTLKDPKIKDPGYIWVDDEGNIFVTCGSYPPGGRIVRIPFDLTVEPAEWKVYEGKGLKGNSFAPGQVCVTDSGLFMTDTISQRVIRINDIGARTVAETGAYGNGTLQFIDPKGMSEDEDGTLYIVDSNNDRLVKMENIRGKGWKVYETSNPMFGLRSPNSVYVWSPRPSKEEMEDQEKAEQEKKEKEAKENKEQQPEEEGKAKFVTSPTGNGSGFAL